ncbi:nucleotidyltransferase family protein [Microbacterium excoecariae]|uniref:nucleotidyltransferase family protein n=1 Tax=Microbacterium excoecariae TaxID=2715210 RepID=UPI001408EC3B|nr:NTP transferase domain-containing protein [Microbacterium excoecariae]NHI16152.1 NTP transferase domain-containing protein [Microbacterium excoecariae]
MHAVTGIVLAGGAGRRFGGPKALARTAEGTPWLARAVRALEGGGVADVVVALGARADEARALVPRGARVVVAAGWERGVSATLRAALAATRGSVLVIPVDTPDLPAAAAARILAAGEGPDALVQATYGGRPGHPALIGSAHVAPLASQLAGDRGARRYLATHGAREIPCDDLFSGEDIDTPHP